MGPEVTDLEWLRATFPGANIYLMSLGHDYSISFANRLVTLPVASAATRNEHAIRRTLGIRNDVGCEGAYIYYDEGGFRHRRVRDDDVRPAWTAQQVAASINALEAFCRAVSAPRKAAELPALDFVAPRDAVVERTTPATLPLEYWEPVAIDAGGRVRMTRRRFLSGFYEWSLSILGPNGIVSWRVAPSDAPRIHAELCALRDEVSGLITRDEALRRPPVEPPPPAPVEPPKCAECGAACPGASMCVYCLHRLDNATRSPQHRASELGPSAVLDAVGEARERLDTEPSFHEGCGAWASACWDGEDWGKP